MYILFFSLKITRTLKIAATQYYITVVCSHNVYILVALSLLIISNTIYKCQGPGLITKQLRV